MRLTLEQRQQLFQHKGEALPSASSSRNTHTNSPGPCSLCDLDLDVENVLETTPSQTLSSRGWSLESLLKTRNFFSVPRVSISNSDPASLNEHIEKHRSSGLPLIIEGCNEQSGWKSHNVLRADISTLVEQRIGSTDSIETEDCPYTWKQWLHAQRIVPDQLLPDDEEHNLLMNLRWSRVETLARHVAKGSGVFTPIRKPLCASLLYNLMCYSENASSSFWFMTQERDARDAAEHFQNISKQEVDHEDYVATLELLADAPFVVWVAEQKVGDLVLVPSRSCYQIVNHGGLNVQLSWATMNLKALMTAIYHELPLYRRVCRPEILHIKATLHDTVKKWTLELVRYNEAWKHAQPSEREKALRRFNSLEMAVRAYQFILKDECVEDHCLPIAPRETLVDVSPQCDFCGLDIFQSYFECSGGCSIESCIIVCSGCYVDGRSCLCGSLHPRQRQPQDILLRDRRKSIEALIGYCLTLPEKERPNFVPPGSVFEDKTGVFRAACYLSRIRMAKHNARSTLCSKHHQSARSLHYLKLLYGSNLHAVTNLFQLQDQSRPPTADSRSIYTEKLPAYLMAELKGEALPDCEVQLVNLAVTFPRCRPINPTCTRVGWYDLNVVAPTRKDPSPHVSTTSDTASETQSDVAPLHIPSDSLQVLAAAKKISRMSKGQSQIIETQTQTQPIDSEASPGSQSAQTTIAHMKTQLQLLEIQFEGLMERFHHNSDPDVLEEALEREGEITRLKWKIEVDAVQNFHCLPIGSEEDILFQEFLEATESTRRTHPSGADYSDAPQYLSLWTNKLIQTTTLIRLLLIVVRMPPAELLILKDLLAKKTATDLEIIFCESQTSKDVSTGAQSTIVSCCYGDEIIATSSSGVQLPQDRPRSDHSIPSYLVHRGKADGLSHTEASPFIRNTSCLRYILSMEEPANFLLTAEPVWIPSIMHLIQLELDDRNSTRLHRMKCLSCLRSLARVHRVLPPTFLIADVTRKGTNAVGGGGFADIWIGTANGKPACLKALRMYLSSDQQARDQIKSEFCHEALLWRQLKHPNVLPFWGISDELFAPSFCLIFPWMDNGDIMAYMKKNPNFDRLNAILDITQGLAYLHSLTPPIIHGDIRGANIIVTDDLRCCLADFGLAIAAATTQARTGVTSGTGRGSTRWMAPELIDPSYGGEVVKSKFSRDKRPRDIYAFGCTVLEVLTQKPPFSDSAEPVLDVTVMFKVLEGKRPTKPEKVWCPTSVWSLVEQCWADNRLDRPPAHVARNFVKTLWRARDKGGDDYLNFSFDDYRNSVAVDSQTMESLDLDSHEVDQDVDVDLGSPALGEESPEIHREWDMGSAHLWVLGHSAHSQADTEIMPYDSDLETDWDRSTVVDGQSRKRRRSEQDETSETGMRKKLWHGSDRQI